MAKSKAAGKQNGLGATAGYIKLKRDLHPLIVNSKTKKRKRAAFESLERMSAESSPESGAKLKNPLSKANAVTDLTSAFTLKKRIRR